MNHPDEKQLGRKEFILIFQVTVHHPGKSGQKPKGRDQSRNAKNRNHRETLHVVLPAGSHLASFIQPRAICLGMVLPAVGWAFLPISINSHDSNPHKHAPTGLIWVIFELRLSSHLATGCVRMAVNMKCLLLNSIFTQYYLTQFCLWYMYMCMCVWM